MPVNKLHRTSNWLTNSIQQTPSWGTNSLSGIQAIPHILCNQKVHYLINHSQPPGPIPSLNNPVHSSPSYIWRSILILCYHLRLGLPSGLFLTGFPTKSLYAPVLSYMRATYRTHFILPDLIIRIIFSEQYRTWSSSLCSPLHSPLNFPS